MLSKMVRLKNMKMNTRVTTVLLVAYFFFYVSFDAQAQTFSINGIIKDAATQETMPSVHIFLNGTSIGTISKTDGTFTLEEIPEGTFELSISFIGYETGSYLLDTGKLDEFYEILLKPSVLTLDELVITPQKYGPLWDENMKVFQRLFIGTSSRAEKVKIVNPKALNFDYDPYTKIFEAWAHEPIIIKNDALGYEIDYYLDEFTVDYNTDQIITLGRPAFKPLKSKRKRTNERWEESRKEAYLGSMDHFLQCLIKSQLSVCGYELRAEQRTETERRVSSELATESDVVTQIDEVTFELSFYNYMNVVYLNESETREFVVWGASSLSGRLRGVEENQKSVLTLNNEEKRVLIKRNGYIDNPRSLLKGGYWAFEKIADLLPLDYVYIQN